jgi:hypothetical protein
MFGLTPFLMWIIGLDNILVNHTVSRWNFYNIRADVVLRMGRRRVLKGVRGWITWARKEVTAPGSPGGIGIAKCCTCAGSAIELESMVDTEKLARKLYGKLFSSKHGKCVCFLTLLLS